MINRDIEMVEEIETKMDVHVCTETIYKILFIYFIFMCGYYLSKIDKRVEKIETYISKQKEVTK